MIEDGETKERAQELVRQIQEKAVQLSDLEVILEDYKRERRELLREIGQLKASLWELIGDVEIPPHLHARSASSLDKVEKAR